MPKKSSAYYQRQYRERLRSQGLVKKEVWIIPDHAKTLSAVENLLRDEVPASNLTAFIDNDNFNRNRSGKDISQNIVKKPSLEDRINATQAQFFPMPQRNQQCWTTRKLFEELQRPNNTVDRLSHVKLALIEPKVEDDEPIIHMNMQDFGDLPIFMTVQGEQIIAETILCMVDEIIDVCDFNDMVLRTHKYFPLSTISLDTLTMADGNTYDAYQMFGSLSATASLQEIMLEIQMVASNVMQALEAYSDCFKSPS